MTCEEKLKNLGILSLRARQILTDLIQTYKILQGLDNVDSRKWFKTVGNGVTRLTRQTAYPGNFREEILVSQGLRLWALIHPEVEDLKVQINNHQPHRQGDDDDIGN